MIDSDSLPVPYSKQPRGLATLARPVRKIPYKLQLLNPERRMPRSPRMTLPPLLESTSLGNLSSMSGFSASSVGSMHASASLPMILHRVDAEVLRSRYNDPKFYRRDHLTIWGGADYQLHLKKKIKVKSKYLSFLPEQNVDAAERARQRKLESVKKLMRESARIFQKADTDGDGQLNFEEFCDLVKLQNALQRRAHVMADRHDRATTPVQTEPMPSREMMKDWFHLIDANHSGEVSMTEFFGFSLREALKAADSEAPNLLAFLSIWDTNKDDELDIVELEKVTTALGFAAITKELLENCDTVKDGTAIKIAQVTAALQDKAIHGESKPFFEVASQIAQRPISSISSRKKSSILAKKKPQKGPNSGRSNEALFPQIDADAGFAIVAALSRIDQRAKTKTFYDPKDAAVRISEDVSQALAMLRSWMRMQGLRALEVFQSWDQSGDLLLTRREVHEGLARYGLEFTPELTTLVFDHIADGYRLRYDDFKDWFESTKYSGLTEAERERRAAVYIQKLIRGRAAKRKVAARRDSPPDSARPGTVVDHFPEPPANREPPPASQQSP